MTKILESTPWDIDGAIVHIGAGQCGELDEYLKTSASRIVLVEPNPDNSCVLKQHAREHSRVEVIEAAVSALDGNVSFYIYNLDRFTGVQAPEFFANQLPGLCILEKISATSISARKLMGKIALEKNKKNCLIIEVLGEELNIISELKEDSSIYFFEYIAFNISPCFINGDGITSENLLSALAKIGYRASKTVINEAGDFVYVVKIDEYWKAVNKYIEEISELKKQIDKDNRKEEENTQEIKRKSELLHQLEKNNQQLQDENNDMKKQQRLLEDELNKAGVQIDFIKDLFFKEEKKE